MKTAKQINDAQIGQVEPMVISKMKADEIMVKLRKTSQWVDKPDSIGWWWCAEKINGKWDIDTDKLFMVDGELHDNEGYPVNLRDKCKWLKITEPKLPE